VGTLAILALGIFMIGSKDFLFTSGYHVKANFDTVAGLDNGAEVRVGGVHKGTVTQIQLPKQSNEKVTVVMNLEKSTRDVVKTDSVASIQTEGLMGNKYVDISFGSEDAPRVHNWDFIQSAPPFDISDLIKKTNEVLDSGKIAMDNIGQVAGSLDSVSAKAKEGAAAFDENMEALKHNFFLRGFYKKRGYTDSTDLTRYEIAGLPRRPDLKSFSFDAAKIFDKPDAAKLKNQKSLDPAGKFLEQNKFGLAVVVSYSGMKGDSEKDLELSQARAMVVRDYLAQNFKLDDTRVRTLARGKTIQSGGSDTAGVEIIVYPPGVEIPERTPVRASR
jgi:phospholipid/cholesterol/gamma-HCH transport system substrate-binding protein